MSVDCLVKGKTLFPFYFSVFQLVAVEGWCGKAFLPWFDRLTMTFPLGTSLKTYSSASHSSAQKGNGPKPVFPCPA